MIAPWVTEPAPPLAASCNRRSAAMSPQRNSFTTIGEAASRSDRPPNTIRVYEEIGLIELAGRFVYRCRAYSDTDAHTLRFTSRAHRLSFAVNDIRALLSLYLD